MSGEGASALKRRWLSNSAANLLGGLGTALANLMLPGIVARYLAPNEFAAWSLALQILIYVNLLSLGVQNATARFIAHVAEKTGQKNDLLPEIVCATRSITIWAGWFSAFAVVLISIGYPNLFSDLPQNLRESLTVALLVIGSAAVARIMSMLYMGVFQGLHKNFVFVMVQLSSRWLAVFLVWLGARARLSLVGLATLMALGLFAVWPGMLISFRRLVPWAARVRDFEVNKKIRREILNYCLSLSVWSISMLLVESVGIIFVGRFDFRMTGPYAVALAAGGILVGFINAALSPLMTNAAALHSTAEGRAKLPGLLSKATISVIIVLNVLTASLMLGYKILLRLWIGERYVAATGPLLILVIASYCLRNFAAPYALMMLATGLHRLALWSAIIEGVGTVACSYWLGINYGAQGVAFGALVGAIIGLFGMLLYNIGRTPELIPSAGRFVLFSVAAPCLLLVPLNVYLAAHVFGIT